ncbi:glycerate kinase family protein [Companilactobacillus zhongbaensis]|uniref:glycerate kinase family protein n=1 Tax=Companilactobacillus zhongbaensis TaxID=2486009 RepID=UPI000F7A6CAB|nr:glycerate kinase [Companilactobacillus zhongbaensis]
MKIVLAPDSFKGSMTAKQVALSMQRGLEKVLPDANYLQIPMADGGEGTVQSLVDAKKGELLSEKVLDPLGNLVTAHYGMIDDGKVAVIEMAEASGIQFINKKTSNPYIATTYGTGQLINAAINKGAKTVIIGLGGSATNDGGAGMAQALGANLLDKHGNELSFGGAELKNLARIDISDMAKELNDVKIIIASDVTNPLTGKDGASAVFGPQKGATPRMVKVLDKALRNYAQVIKNDLGKEVEEVAGAGAAGGLGAGLLAFTNAEIQPGVEIVLKYTDFKKQIADADFVFTGEGQIDFQTKYGKTPIGVAKAAKEVDPNIKVIAIAGSVGEKIEELYPLGIDAIFSCVPGVVDLETAINNSDQNIQKIINNIGRLIQVMTLK